MRYPIDVAVRLQSRLLRQFDLESYDPGTRCALLTYWNGHRWLPADAGYLLDMLGGFKRGRLVMMDGAIQPARVVISVAEATAVGWGRKPVARGWLGSQL